MRQQDRDRLVALKKAQMGLITQRQAAEEMGQTERHIRRLLVKLKREGDQAVIHGMRGRGSNRKLEEKTARRRLQFRGRKSIAASGRHWLKKLPRFPGGLPPFTSEPTPSHRL